MEQVLGMFAKELGEGAKTEDILKVMESLGGVALKMNEKEDFIFGLTRRRKMRIWNLKRSETYG